MDAIGVIVIMFTGLWLFLPAMVPNSAAVVFGGKTKIDFGKSWRGRRIFGDGKSWRGFFGGALSGIAFGLILIAVSSIWDPTDYWGYGPFWDNVGVLACLAFGAVLGDLCGAFIKRRLGMERGQKAPVLNYIEGWHIAALIFIIVIMFAIHRIVNIIGYRMGLKKEPW